MWKSIKYIPKHALLRALRAFQWQLPLNFPQSRTSIGVIAFRVPTIRPPTMISRTRKAGKGSMSGNLAYVKYLWAFDHKATLIVTEPTNVNVKKVTIVGQITNVSYTTKNSQVQNRPTLTLGVGNGAFIVELNNYILNKKAIPPHKKFPQEDKFAQALRSVKGLEEMHKCAKSAAGSFVVVVWQ